MTSLLLGFVQTTATIAAGQKEGGFGNISPNSISSYLTGRMVMNTVSVASWFTSAFSFIMDLLKLLKGPVACLQVEPRVIYDPFTYQALNMGYIPEVSSSIIALCYVIS